jgi:hypothetical protein
MGQFVMNDMSKESFDLMAQFHKDNMMSEGLKFLEQLSIYEKTHYSITREDDDNYNLFLSTRLGHFAGSIVENVSQYELVSAIALECNFHFTSFLPNSRQNDEAHERIRWLKHRVIISVSYTDLPDGTLRHNSMSASVYQKMYRQYLRIIEECPEPCG